MADGMDGAITAPRDQRAVIVFESGVTVSLRLKTREGFEAKRTIAQGKIETGYKISDGTVDDPKIVTFEGIITGADFPYTYGLLYTNQNMIQAMNQAQQIMAAYELKELFGIHIIMAMPQSVIQSLSVEAVPKKNCYNIKLTAQKVETVTSSVRAINQHRQKLPIRQGRGQ